GTYMDVGNEALALADIGLHAAPEGVELVFRERPVDVAPGDLGLGALLLDDEAIRRGTAGAMAGLDDQGAVRGQLAFTATDGLLDQLCGTDIGINGWICLRHVGPRRPEA